MQRGPQFTLIANFWTLSKFKLSFKFWIIVICLWGILIKNLALSSLLSFFWVITLTLSFLPVLDVTFTGDWSSLTGDRDDYLTGDLHCPFIGDAFSLTRDVGPFTMDVTFLFLVRLMRVVLTSAAVFNQKMYSFVMKITIFFIWWRFIWRYLRIIRRGTNIWVVSVFFSIILTF